MPKKKILFNSNYSRFRTGLGRNARAVLTYLYKQGYDVVEYCAGPVRWSGLETKLVPWKCYGALPDSDEEINQVLSRFDNQDHRDSAHAQMTYGAYNLSKVMEIEKPDLFIASEDIWGGFPEYMTFPFWKHIPKISWLTFDSLPLMEIFTNNVESFGRIFTKSPFAIPHIEAAGGECRWVPDIIPSYDYYRLPEDKIKELKQKHGLQDQTVFIFNFRNQTRKHCLVLIEALNELVREGKKVKLILHTNWTENKGWDIAREVRRLGLQEHVICTYLCRKCANYELTPFSGPEKTCGCGAEGAMVNPNFHHGVSEDQLNEIYNISDFFFHPANSGAVEMPIIEALIAGTPGATIPYSYGTMFTDDNLVDPIELALYREMTSGFYKAAPTLESVVKLMKKYESMSPEDRQKWSADSEKWAKDKFDSSKWLKILEEEIEAMPENTYDWRCFNELNNTFPIPKFVESESFIKEIYSGVFNRDIPPNEFKGAVNAFEQLGPEGFYQRTIDIANQHIAEKQATNPESWFKQNGKKRTVVSLKGDIGDSLILLGALEQYYKTHPDWDIYISCEDRYKQIYEHLEWINFLPFVHPWNEEFWLGSANTPKLADVFYSPGILTQAIFNYNRTGNNV